MSENMKEDITELFRLIASLEKEEEIRLLFEDLCTYKEVESMAQRLKAAKLLLEGSTYADIIKETSVSPTTLSRVSRCVKYGNGYKTILKK